MAANCIKRLPSPCYAYRNVLATTDGASGHPAAPRVAVLKPFEHGHVFRHVVGEVGRMAAHREVQTCNSQVRF